MYVHFSSKTSRWSTPQAVFDILDAEFRFSLDACADPENAKCARYYTAEQDGLVQPWSGNVWCNPPYGRSIAAWIKKGYDSATHGATVVMLIPSRTDTRWWHGWVMHGEIRFLRGRLKFGGAVNPAPFPSAVVVFRPGHNYDTSNSGRKEGPAY